MSADRQAFFIPGPLPGMNDMLDAKARMGKGRGRTARWNSYNAMKRKWEELISWEIARARIKPVNGPVIFSFHWIEPKTRSSWQRDLDNIAAGKKFVLDALVSAGILPDDKRQWVTGWTDRFPEPGTGEAGVNVIIEPAQKEAA